MTKCKHEWGIWGEAHSNEQHGALFRFLQQYRTCKLCGYMMRRKFAVGFSFLNPTIANQSRNF